MRRSKNMGLLQRKKLRKVTVKQHGHREQTRTNSGRTLMPVYEHHGCVAGSWENGLGFELRGFGFETDKLCRIFVPVFSDRAVVTDSQHSHIVRVFVRVVPKPNGLSSTQKPSSLFV